MTHPDPLAATAITEAARDRWNQLHHNAVRVLTDAVTFEPVAGEPIDFADFLSGVLTAVAANVGSVHRLVAGRGGSWEADHLRSLARGERDRVLPLAGGDLADVEWLAPHRSTPIVVPLNLPDLIDATGRLEFYEPSTEEGQAIIQERADELGVSTEEWLHRTNGTPSVSRWIPLLAEHDTFEGQPEAAWDRYDRYATAGESDVRHRCR